MKKKKTKKIDKQKLKVPYLSIEKKYDILLKKNLKN